MIQDQDNMIHGGIESLSLLHAATWILVGLMILITVLVVWRLCMLRRIPGEARADDRPGEHDQAQEMLAQMSHEIRTPVAAIVGYMDLLEDMQHDRKAWMQMTSTIKGNCDHLLSLVDDILDAARIDSGTVNIDRRSVDPLKIIREAVGAIAPEAARKNLQVRVIDKSMLPDRIATDPTRLRQILINLMANAVRFTDEGKIQVEIELMDGPPSKGSSWIGQRLDRTGFLVCRIRDTGIGMSPNQVEQLFKPFSQAHDRQTQARGGTGLGLSISRRLAKLLGGDISIRSRIGVGSCFTMHVATGPITHGGLDRERQQQSPAKTGAPTLHGLRILVADDGRENRDVLTRMIRNAGGTVTSVEDAESAINSVRMGEFDIVLMDIQMPGLDGLSATRSLRQSGHRLPVIAMTARSSDVITQECLAAGCTACATTPMAKTDLVHLLSQHGGTWGSRAG
ncbi:MAG: hypothetical protein CMJ32_05940 [Phycisphaerae bacterium]|nr:hypothetical protein [Phycisphaerae bacterium]